MTTPATARLYEAQHLLDMESKGYAVFNPHDKSIDELPVIYGFNNGGSDQMLMATLLAEDGTGLGGHCCSTEGYMRHDLGILDGTRSDRHEDFQKHYPDGYRMDFVPLDIVKAGTHEGLESAYKLHQEKSEPEAT